MPRGRRFLVSFLMVLAGCLSGLDEPSSDGDAGSGCSEPAWETYRVEAGRYGSIEGHHEKLDPVVLAQLGVPIPDEPPQTSHDGILFDSRDDFQVFLSDLAGDGTRILVALRTRTSGHPFDDKYCLPCKDFFLYFYRWGEGGPERFGRQCMHCDGEDWFKRLEFCQLDEDPAVEIVGLYGYRDTTRCVVVEWDGSAFARRELRSNSDLVLSDLDGNGIQEILERTSGLGSPGWACCEAARIHWYDVFSLGGDGLVGANGEHGAWFRARRDHAREELARLRAVFEAGDSESYADYEYELSANEELLKRCEELLDGDR